MQDSGGGKIRAFNMPLIVISDFINDSPICDACVETQVSR